MASETEGWINTEEYRSGERGESLGHGREWEVFDVGDNVLKILNVYNSEGERRPEGELSWWNGEKRKQDMENDQEVIQKILGDIYVPLDYQFINKTDGNQEIIAIQRKIVGESVNNLLGTELYPNEEQFITKHREQMAETIWGLKKVFTILQAPVDFHTGNMMEEKDTGKIYLIDVGSPTIDRRKIFDEDPSSRTSAALSRAYKRLERLEHYEEVLELSEKEKGLLDHKYDVTSEDYFRAKKALLDRQDQLGITDEELSENKKEVTVDSMLEDIFGDKEKVTGNDVILYTMKILAKERQKPTPQQEQILEMLKEQAEMPADRKHWKEVIERGMGQ